MYNQAASTFLNSVIDYREIAQAIEADKSALGYEIRRKIRFALMDLEPSTCLSFRLVKNGTFKREVQLSASLEYAQVLIAYMREDKYEGYAIESSVTPVVLKATEQAIVGFYSGEEVQEKISEGISNQIRQSRIIKDILAKDIKANQTWLKHEIKTLLADESASSIAGRMIDSVSDSIVSFLSSTMGQNLMAAIGKFMATGMGKILMQQIGIVVAKALASGVLKSVILMAIKKIGVGILIKTVVGKAIIALLALVGITGIPLAWIIIPIIAGVLIYEYNSFPEKLAEKIPNSVAANINSNFESLNNTVVEEIVSVITGDLVGHLTKVRKFE
ncbi:MAG: hypothetical protein AAF927_05975 [Bacteroidota bacterium]